MAPAIVEPFSAEVRTTISPSFVLCEEERPKVKHNHFSDAIPIISLAGINEAGGRRSEICQKIVKACEEWGIFQVVDHGVDSQLISDMFRLTRQFFALSPDEKLQYDMSGGKKGGFLVSSHLRVIFPLTIFSFSTAGLNRKIMSCLFSLPSINMLEFEHHSITGRSSA